MSVTLFIDDFACPVVVFVNTSNHLVAHVCSTAKVEYGTVYQFQTKHKVLAATVFRTFTKK
jgi:hypothetical protein